MLQAVRVLAVAAILGAPGRLHKGRTPGLGADCTQKGRGVKGAGTDLDVVGLEQRAPLFVPKILETQNDFLKCWHDWALKKQNKG